MRWVYSYLSANNLVESDTNTLAQWTRHRHHRETIPGCPGRWSGSHQRCLSGCRAAWHRHSTSMSVWSMCRWGYSTGGPSIWGHEWWTGTRVCFVVVNLVQTVFFPQLIAHKCLILEFHFYFPPPKSESSNPSVGSLLCYFVLYSAVPSQPPECSRTVSRE